MPPSAQQTEYTAITILVVLPSVREAAEAAAIAADPDAGAGTFIPGVPLRTAGGPNVPAAYWARWNMKQSQRSAFATSMGGPNNIIAAGGNVNLNRDRWFFDAVEGAWTPQQVLDVLGFDVYEHVDNW